MNTDKQLIKQIKKDLKKDLEGRMSEAARSIGMSAASISRFLNGKQENKKNLLEALIKFRKEVQRRDAQTIQKLRKKLSQ